MLPSALSVMRDEALRRRRRRRNMIIAAVSVAIIAIMVVVVVTQDEDDQRTYTPEPPSITFKVEFVPALNETAQSELGSLAASQLGIQMDFPDTEFTGMSAPETALAIARLADDNNLSEAVRVVDVEKDLITYVCSDESSTSLCGRTEPIAGCPSATMTGATCQVCIPGHYGSDCDPCTVTCGGHGQCKEGREADGSCLCEEGWTGESCSYCNTEFFGPSCSPCQDCTGIGLERCSDGLTGDGHCLCPPGFDVDDGLCLECSDGFFGSLCTRCPKCLDNAKCDDGRAGKGDCVCIEGRGGPLCHECVLGYFGSDCTRCSSDCGENGRCDDGISGQGHCICDEGFAGENCEIECLPCSPHGQCRSGYQGDGTCACDEGFDGMLCSTCAEGFTGESCNQCERSFFGSQCIACTVDCSVRGSCSDGKTGDGTCICVAHAQGPFCSECEFGWGGETCATRIVPSGGVQSFNWCGRRRVAVLSFDDGPSKPVASTMMVMDELAANNVKGTFYLSPRARGIEPWGDQCQAVQRMVREGHGIQAHTWSHSDILQMDFDTIDNELEQTERWLQTCTGLTPEQLGLNQIRPPFGNLDNVRARYLAGAGYTVASWNVDSYDYNGGTSQEIVERTTWAARQYTQGGNSVVVLMHDTSTQPGVITSLVDFFRSQDYQIVTSAQCYASCRGSSGVCRSPWSEWPGVFT